MAERTGTDFVLCQYCGAHKLTVQLTAFALGFFCLDISLCISAHTQENREGPYPNQSTPLCHKAQDKLESGTVTAAYGLC